jgi:flagellar hook assembly protein FlgD
VVLPDKYSIAQNYPNPFNSNTVINYIVGAESFDSYEEAVIRLQPVRTTIKIYNLLGQEVRTLVNEPKLPGKYQIFWDARNAAGIPVASGPYFLQAILGDKVFNKKMMVIK